MLRLLSYVLMALQVIGVGIHIWTSYILFTIHGWFGALASFLLPFISEVYLVILSWTAAGTILSQYNAIVFTYIISYVIFFGLIVHYSKIDEIKGINELNKESNNIKSEVNQTDESKKATIEPISKKNKGSVLPLLSIVGMILIRFAFSIVNNELSYAYGLGKFLGNTILITLVTAAIFFLISNLSMKKQYLITSVILFTFLSFMVGKQILVVNVENRNIEIMLRVDEILTQNFDNYFNQRPISKEGVSENELGGLYEFTSATLEYFENIAYKISQTSFPTGIQLDVLYSNLLPADVTAQKYTLHTIETNMERQENFLSEIDDIENRYVRYVNTLIENENITQFKEYLEEFLIGFKHSSNQETEKINKYLSSVNLTYESYCRILEFLIDQENQYYIEDNQYVFYTSENVEEFNGLIEKFVNNYEKLGQDFDL